MQKLSKRERKRLLLMSTNEQRLRAQGHLFIAGTDEVGRGPLAGPVVAAACILPDGYLLSGLNDSKQLNADLRRDLFEHLTNDENVLFGIGIISVERIDQINILHASLEAMKIAVESLKSAPTYLLVDGNRLPLISIPAEAMIAGDARSISIAAASVIAKVTRDRIMIEQGNIWPNYGFGDNKGYGTVGHLEALAHYGPCPVHRRSFEPIKSMTDSQLELF